MKSSVDKSLIEVWEMKEAAWKDFKESGTKNYIEYLNNTLKEIKEKYHIKYWVDQEKGDKVAIK